MKHLFNPRVSGLLLTLLLFAGGTQTALAVGTASNTLISNQATVNYVVGGIGQAAILSEDLVTGPGPTEFRVDNIVNVNVANQDGGNVNVAQGSLGQALTFLVTNVGNTTQGYQLSVVNDTVPAIPMGNIRIFIDHPTLGTVGSFDGADTLYNPALGTGDLDPNVIGADAVTVFIVADTAPVAANLTVDNYSLLATTTNAGGVVVTGVGPANTALGVEVVFADVAGTAAVDAANDGTHSDTASYTVGSAALTVIKSAVALDTFGTDFAIPGATVTYTILVTNAGAVDADSVVITDVISAITSADVAWVVNSITLDTGLGPVAQSDASDSPTDESDFDITAADAVTVDVGTVAGGGGTVEITFQVVIIN